VKEALETEDHDHTIEQAPEYPLIYITAASSTLTEVMSCTFCFSCDIAVWSLNRNEKEKVRYKRRVRATD